MQVAYRIFISRGDGVYTSTLPLSDTKEYRIGCNYTGKTYRCYARPFYTPGKKSKEVWLKIALDDITKVAIHFNIDLIVGRQITILREVSNFEVNMIRLKTRLNMKWLS